MTRTPAPALSPAEAEVVARFDAAPTPPEACRTCRGRTRETVGMVCQTCGTDYAPDPFAEVPVWEEQFDAGPGLVVGLGDARFLLAREVERAEKRAAARALREAADYYKRQLGTVGAFNIPLRNSDFAPWLRARAAALASPAPAPHVHGAWCHPSADGCLDRPGM